MHLIELLVTYSTQTLLPALNYFFVVGNLKNNSLEVINELSCRMVFLHPQQAF